MFNPSRDEVRRFFFDTWAKHQSAQVLTPLEAQALDWMLEHPEYHALLSDPEANLAREWTPADGEMNPFLHLSLHLSVAEQVSIDQPPGIRTEFERLAHKHGSLHEAAHDVLDCLGETVWRAQREGTPPDGEAYLDCVRRR
jgi:hypothetical protein